MSGFGKGFIVGTLFGLNNNQAALEQHKEYVRENESKLRLFKEHLSMAGLSFNAAYASAFDNCKVAILDNDKDPDKRYLYLYKNKTDINNQWENLKFKGSNKYEYENFKVAIPYITTLFAPMKGLRLYLIPNKSNADMSHYYFSPKDEPFECNVWITFSNKIFKNADVAAKPDILDMLNKGQLLPEHIRFIV
jgi:hypothetical protein